MPCGGVRGGRVGAGAWQKVDLDTASFAPGGDPLGFLAAARDVKPGPAETRELGDTTLSYSTFTFELDGTPSRATLSSGSCRSCASGASCPAGRTSTSPASTTNCVAAARFGSTPTGSPRSSSSTSSCPLPRAPARHRPRSPAISPATTTPGWPWPRPASSTAPSAGCAAVLVTAKQDGEPVGPGGVVAFSAPASGDSWKHPPSPP